MLTRRAVARDMEDKLRATLKELESSKTLCKQLLQEREDSEVEVKNIVDKNTTLKNELAELHIVHMDLLDQHQHLQLDLSNFKQCSDTYEIALSRITDLEHELSNAHSTIMFLESAKCREQTSSTQSLFDELVGCSAADICQPIITIDLTGEDAITRPLLFSHNKLKKYIKFNKLIKKSRIALRKFKNLKSKVTHHRNRVNLISQVNTYTKELEQCREKYDVDTFLLQDELLQKEHLLKDVFEKYADCQNQLSKRMVEASELMDLVQYNAERCESLTNNFSCNCAHSAPSLTPPVSQVGAVTQPSADSDTDSKWILISDKIGAGFGTLLHNCNTHNVTNLCYHNTHFSKLINIIKNLNLHKNTNIVLLVGNSLGIQRRDIVDGITTLLSLDIGKIILCALPYADTLSTEQNNFVHYLNNTLCMLTGCHSDKLLFFDTNKFISGFKLTQEAMYLPKQCRFLVARLLAFNINSVIGDITPNRLSTDKLLCLSSNNVDCLN